MPVVVVGDRHAARTAGTAGTVVAGVGTGETTNTSVASQATTTLASEPTTSAPVATTAPGTGAFVPVEGAEVLVAERWDDERQDR